MKNPIDDLKLPKSIIWMIWVASILYMFVSPLVTDIILDSNAFRELKQSKPLDALINMSMPIEISSVSILVSLLFLSLFFNLFLYIRLNLYFQAAKKFGEYFYMVSLKYSKLSGTPVTINFKENNFVIDEKDHK